MSYNMVSLVSVIYSAIIWLVNTFEVAIVPLNLNVIHMIWHWVAAKLYFTYWSHQACTGNSLLKTYSHLFDLYLTFSLFSASNRSLSSKSKNQDISWPSRFSIIIIYNLLLVILKPILCFLALFSSQAHFPYNSQYCNASRHIFI